MHEEVLRGRSWYHQGSSGKPELRGLLLSCLRRKPLLQAEHALQGEGMAWWKGCRLRAAGTSMRRERSVDRSLRGHWLNVSLQMQKVKGGTIAGACITALASETQDPSLNTGLS